MLGLGGIGFTRSVGSFKREKTHTSSDVRLRLGLRVHVPSDIKKRACGHLRRCTIQARRRLEDHSSDVVSPRSFSLFPSVDEWTRDASGSAKSPTRRRAPPRPATVPLSAVARTLREASLRTKTRTRTRTPEKIVRDRTEIFRRVSRSTLLKEASASVLGVVGFALDAALADDAVVLHHPVLRLRLVPVFPRRLI